MKNKNSIEQQPRILVVDDEVISLENISHFLGSEGYMVDTAEDGQNAIDLISSTHYDLVITDLRMEGVDGNQVMICTKERLPDAEVIIITGYATVNSAVDAMARGAFYYLPKPIKLDELKSLVSKALERLFLRREISSLKRHMMAQKGTTQFIGRTPVIQRLKDDMALFAQLECNVLIQGETGTGKELIARIIHEMSPRGEKRFLPINCGALNEELVLNELFGHEKDAYSGATQVKRGLLESADGGVVLLDEIGEMVLPMQSTLLRVLQEKTLFRVGGTVEIPVDIRVLAATNRDLEEEIRYKRFRQDLFYRLNVGTLHVPPLRERKEDIPLLVYHFIDKHKTPGHTVKAVSPDAITLLQHYDFPGNVRELENIIERSLISCSGDEIGVQHLPPSLRSNHLPVAPQPAHSTGKKVKSLYEHERDYILGVIRSVKGNKTQAAKLMGIDRVSLWRKLSRYKKEGVDVDTPR